MAATTDCPSSGTADLRYCSKKCAVYDGFRYDRDRPIATRDMLIIPTTKNFSQGKGGGLSSLKRARRGTLPPRKSFEYWRSPTGAAGCLFSGALHGLLYLCRRMVFSFAWMRITGKAALSRTPNRRSPTAPRPLRRPARFPSLIFKHRDRREGRAELRGLAKNSLFRIRSPGRRAIAVAESTLRGYRWLYAIEMKAK